jgi:hypothetical protein
VVTIKLFAEQQMAWIIDKDHFAEANAKPGTNANAVGVAGPFGYKGDGSELTHKFRMLDDDRELVYEGRASHDGIFQPLDNFGTPNFGCTIIQYWQAGGWKDL